ncbi:unnamed protein product [Chondrus crispus]|uniref:Uncharacterized protein n=1 Tax=Chondrus crispus TaxID=2769 RepID=R7QFL3_CHOCR|nr:unnamed protein product [Chondrus crispus]CDF36241.1 unnamed protein product [Chondrus crispus]|eukprot:XP_005716060.1 unnamed protein product [Chondrus crispus]
MSSAKSRGAWTSSPPPICQSPPCLSALRPPRPCSPSTWRAPPGRSSPRRLVCPTPPPSPRLRFPPRRPSHTLRRTRRSTPAFPRRARRTERTFVHAWRAPSFCRRRTNARDVARVVAYASFAQR